MKTDFDETIGSINIIPQDIGRVILNLINNAFYAVDEKKKQQPEFRTNSYCHNSECKAPLGGLGAKVEIKVRIMATGSLKKYWIKYFNHSLQPNPPGKEQDWDCHWRMIL